MHEFLRIDDRLIHGQVLLSWVPALGSRMILVADDEAASDPVQRDFLQSTTSTVDIRVLSVGEAVQTASKQDDGRGVLVLFRAPESALQYVESGRIPKKINVGCLRFQEGRSQISKSVAAGPGEMQMFERLHRMKISLEISMVPSDKPLDLMKVIENKEYRKRKGKKS